MAASLRKKMNLAHLAAHKPDLHAARNDTDNVTTTINKSVEFPLSHLLEPAIAIIGNEHRVYYAYPSSHKGDVTVLGPDERFRNLSTRSVQGIFTLALFYARLLEWGYDDFWACFFGPVLERLAITE
jgi:hypothetical protein